MGEEDIPVQWKEKNEVKHLWKKKDFRESEGEENGENGKSSVKLQYEERNCSYEEAFCNEHLN